MIVKKYFCYYGLKTLAFFYTTISTVYFIGRIDVGNAQIIDDGDLNSSENGQDVEGRFQAPEEEFKYMQVLHPTGSEFCTASSHCMGHNVECNLRMSRCVCRKYFSKNNVTGSCQECPYEGDPCETCCSQLGVTCVDGRCKRCFTEQGRSLCNNDAILIVTISQIALSAALIMGIAALVVLWYRMCTKTNYLASNYTQSDPEHLCPRDYPRASLTSIQVRILARLRDRPPSYESHHSYDSRIQREQEGQRPTISSTSNPEMNADIHIVTSGGLAPPCYEGGLVSINEQPPPYADSGNSRSGGIIQGSGSTYTTYVNEGYVPIADDQNVRYSTILKPIRGICLITDTEKAVHM